MSEPSFGPEYPKIQTVFKRDPNAHGVIIPGDFSVPEFEFLADVPWRWTEKVDGMNIRLHFDGTEVTVNGRTDNAQVPASILAHLSQLLKARNLWNGTFADSTLVKPYAQDVTVYGEGYGPKIQSGGQYRNSVSFIVFDIKVGRWWLKPEDVAEAAEALGLDVVPWYPHMTLRDAIDVVAKGELQSHWHGAKVEGMVGTPLVQLFDRRGNRIITKLKVSDFDALRANEGRGK